MPARTLERVFRAVVETSDGVSEVDEASFEYARLPGGDERISLLLRGITEAEVPPGAVVRQHHPEID
jgi:hypothetical protein